MRIKVREIAPQRRTVRIRLPLTPIARDMGGGMTRGVSGRARRSHRGHRLCPGVPRPAVWTRALELDFMLEGCADLELRFAFDPEHERAIREELTGKGRGTLCSNTAIFSPMAFCARACAIPWRCNPKTTRRVRENP